ncbi:RPL7A-1 [Symbiodinium sp. KB8]|nr:RPL7A-1 [Symbiodinium sp. KB8]
MLRPSAPQSGRRATNKGAATKRAGKAKTADPLFPARKRNFRIGGDIQDLSRFVRWPRYVRLQRQRKVINQRLKVPPGINQFRHALDRADSVPVFKLFAKYTPESKTEKAARLEAVASGAAAATAPPPVVHFGLKHVTYLIEKRQAKLVLIASDVDPIELIVWLPALCRKMDIPYLMVKSKARLGALVHQKKATAVCLTEVNGADSAAFDTIATMARERFNDNVEIRRKWGGGIMGLKTTKRLEKRDAMMKAEAAKKAMY